MELGGGGGDMSTKSPRLRASLVSIEISDPCL